MRETALPLLRRTTCPHCWTSFAPEETLWISSHSDLLGDPRLGTEQQQRFLPTRFDVHGNALDARGLICTGLACPRCHLPLPRAILEMEPLFISILGTPACGKSYYLTALLRELRRLLPLHFALSFEDADPVSNRVVNEYEEALFHNPRAEELIPLADLIRKTELQGELYDTVMYGNQQVNYPRPFLFTLRPQNNHPQVSATRQLARVVCLYDNAGEHFQPGQDSTANPGTQHLAQSRLLLFVFDPTQDQRFRKLYRNQSDSPTQDRTTRQLAVLQETAARIRRLTGLSQGEKHSRQLIVIVNKSDVWSKLLPDPGLKDPWLMLGQPLGLDLDVTEQRSAQVRDLLYSACPEVVSSAENFAEHVVYIPVSALGRTPTPDPKTKAPAIQPSLLNPVWVTVPFLFGLTQCLPGVINGARRKQSHVRPSAAPPRKR